MIDFDESKISKLKANADYGDKVTDILGRDERVISAFSSLREGIILTDKRLISINVKGAGGKKMALACIPYSKINLYTVTSSGNFDRDSEIEISVTGMGVMTLQFAPKTDIKEILQILASFVD